MENCPDCMKCDMTRCLLDISIPSARHIVGPNLFWINMEGLTPWRVKEGKAVLWQFARLPDNCKFKTHMISTDEILEPLGNRLVENILPSPAGESAGKSDLHYSKRLAPGGDEVDGITILRQNHIRCYLPFPHFSDLTTWGRMLIFILIIGNIPYLKG